MVTTIRSPDSAASCPVPARASGPSSAARSARVCGPRELLSTTGYPAATASLATVLPMRPLPISPTVVMDAVTPAGQPAFRAGGSASGATQRVQERLHPRTQIIGGAGRDEVAVDNGGLVHPVDTGVDHVVADRPDAGGAAALDDLRGDRYPAGVADEGDRLPRRIELPDQVQHRRRAPQLVRRVAAG